MSQAEQAHPISPALLKELYRHAWPHNLKILLVTGMLIGFSYIAWNTPNFWLRWLLYGAIGYLWMGIVTFMHDCAHDVLFKARWKNWAFGFLSTLPLLVTFSSFREDHLAHHRYNRSARDPDAFTMGKRGVLDFVLFYAYLIVGGVLIVIHFTLLYPLQKFDRKKWLVHGSELLLRVVVTGGLILWTSHLGVLTRFLQVWLIPLYLFTLLNSMRYIAEHYETPWDSGQLRGTRTIISNQVNSFFWNNINYHIGHHVYPGVPWYNLQRLHRALRPEIERSAAVIDSGYLRVLFKACRRGPESIERTALYVGKRAGPTVRPGAGPSG
jgi:fatty acid desaturase